MYYNANIDILRFLSNVDALLGYHWMGLKSFDIQVMQILIYILDDNHSTKP